MHLPLRCVCLVFVVVLAGSCDAAQPVVETPRQVLARRRAELILVWDAASQPDANPMVIARQLHDAREALVAALSIVYGDSVSATTNDMVAEDARIAALNQLLIDWNPIGWSLNSVRTLLGEPWREQDDRWEYDFYHGIAGVRTLTLRRNEWRITAIEYAE